MEGNIFIQKLFLQISHKDLGPFWDLHVKKLRKLLYLWVSSLLHIDSSPYFDYISVVCVIHLVVCQDCSNICDIYFIIHLPGMVVERGNTGFHEYKNLINMDNFNLYLHTWWKNKFAEIIGKTCNITSHPHGKHCANCYEPHPTLKEKLSVMPVK